MQFCFSSKEEDEESSKYIVVCKTEPLEDDARLNDPLPIRIVWTDLDVSDERTQRTFTYKADPEIEHIFPEFTVVRLVFFELSPVYFLN